MSCWFPARLSKCACTSNGFSVQTLAVELEQQQLLRSFTWTSRLRRLVVSIMNEGTSLLYIILPTHRRRTTLFRPEKQRAMLFSKYVVYIFLGEICWVVVIAGCRRSVTAEASGLSEVVYYWRRSWCVPVYARQVLTQLVWDDHTKLSSPPRHFV